MMKKILATVATILVMIAGAQYAHADTMTSTGYSTTGNITANTFLSVGNIITTANFISDGISTNYSTTNIASVERVSADLVTTNRLLAIADVTADLLYVRYAEFGHARGQTLPRDASFNFGVIGAGTGNVLNIYGFDSQPVFSTWHSGGDWGNQSATGANTKIIGIEGFLRGSSSYSGDPRVGIYGRTNQAASDTAQGTYIDFKTTSANTTETREVVRINGDGLIIPFVTTVTPNPTEGGFFYHDTHNHFAYYNGTTWITLKTTN